MASSQTYVIEGLKFSIDSIVNILTVYNEGTVLLHTMLPMYFSQSSWVKLI